MIRTIAVSILLLILFVSCAAPETEISTQVPVLESPQPTPFPERADIGDGGLLSGLPCAAPCVYGIQIGETPLDQVIPMLEQNGLSECQRSASFVAIVWLCRWIEQPASSMRQGFFRAFRFLWERSLKNTESQILFI